ncbi:hypothetical protein TNIN_131821 [Trichonephila inaurata madagascariensis]|uniref:Uncharacterized protein n=1 Tax=Trichonephila inaurata madagascariensis TaxID=2747483 RepID=A0A8X6YTA6_9ARAC|nr:hypothetical protein TNIN_131821 [Trichonephila inaurata madagascariensis]
MSSAATLQRPESCETFRAPIIHPNSKLYPPVGSSTWLLDWNSSVFTLHHLKVPVTQLTHLFTRTRTSRYINRKQLLSCCCNPPPPPLAFSDRSDLLDIWSATIPCKKS